MFSYLILAITLVYGVCYIFIQKKDSKKITQKVLAVLVLASYAMTLYDEYAIDKTFAQNGVLFTPLVTTLMVFLRWCTTVVIACAIVYPFFGGKSIKRILEYIAPVIALLNIIFVETNLIANYGNEYMQEKMFRIVGCIATYTSLALVSFTFVYNKIKNKEFNETKKDIGWMFLIFVLLMPAFFQQGAIQIFFGEFGETTKDFVGIHRFTLYMSVLIMLLIYGFMRGRSKEDKDILFGFLSLAGLLQYFYVFRGGLNGLPLHLCNTAVVLIFFGFVFKISGIFYFTYFVNVIGSIAAMLLPNITADAYYVRSVHYWYNHIYAFILPVLGVALGVYPRPNLKMMRGAIAIFTLYFVTVAVLNAWFNNYESVDFFFIYSDFFPEKFAFAVPIRNNYILDIPVGDLTFRFYYLMQILVYIIYIGLMFLTWVVYDYLYKVSDRHYQLLVKKRLNRQGVIDLKKLLNGRDLGEPVEPSMQGKVVIENFTKIYSGNNYKSVDDFNLVVNAGEVYGFLGHNGAGKSTTIKSLVGIHGITEGRMLVDGYDVEKQPVETKVRIGYVSDNHAVYEKLTGREYINYVADLYLVSQEDRDERIEKYIRMFKLEKFIDHQISTYSHGMKQKIVVIASLIHDPKIWILDEPLTGLDPTSAFQIKECMRDHANRGNIVFFSSHVIEVVEKVCDKICIISKGKLQGVYKLEDLRNQNISLEQLYIKQILGDLK